MIHYHYETDFRLDEESDITDWLNRIIQSEAAELDFLDYIFCNDEALYAMNSTYLQHESYTDVITFEYSEGRGIAGDVFISIDRVRDNADALQLPFRAELLRVMAHGLLHLLGYGDKEEQESRLMRKKENEKLQMFHVEH